VFFLSVVFLFGSMNGISGATGGCNYELRDISIYFLFLYDVL